MIVYAESNFLLELALVQEGHASCQRLVEWSEDSKIRLAIPAYSFVEPYGTLRRRHGERIRIAESAREQIKLLRRSSSFTTSISEFSSLAGLFQQGTQAEGERFEDGAGSETLISN